MDRRSILKSAVLATGVAAAGVEAEAAASSHGQRGVALEIHGRPDKALRSAIQRIADYADLHRRSYGLPGLTLVCTAPGGVTAFVRSGYSEVETRKPVRADHLFQIGSISKSFVAMAIHQLAAEGRFSLTDDIRKVLPDVPLGPEPAISLINLLEHSSGLPDDAPLFPEIGDGKLWSAFTPGSAWSYSNTAYDLLGKVIERHDRATLEKSLSTRIFTPLGMSSARGAITDADRARYAVSYRPYSADEAHIGGRLARDGWVEVNFGAGCVAATTADMEKWLRYLSAAANGRGAPLLPDPAARVFTRPGIAAPGWAVSGAHYGAGLAHVPVEGRTLLHHTGGMVTFSSSIHVDPVADVGCFASTNSGEQEYRPREVTAYACAVLRAAVAPEKGLAPQPAPIRIPPPPPKAAAQLASTDPALALYVGRYENDNPWQGQFRILSRGDRLFLDGAGELERHADGYWTVKAPISTERLWFTGIMNGQAQVAIVSGNRFVRRDI